MFLFSFFLQSPQAAAPITSWVMDFENGVYTVGDSTAALADIMARPDLVSGGVLAIPNSDVTVLVGILGEPLTLLLTYNWTFFIDATLVTTSSALLFEVQDAGETTTIIVGTFSVTDSDGINFREADYDGYGPPTSTPDRHRIAVTRTNSKLAVSIDGGAVVSDTIDPAPTLAAIAAYLGGNSDGTQGATNIYKTSLTTIPVTDGELAILTTWTEPTVTVIGNNASTGDPSFVTGVDIPLGSTVVVVVNGLAAPFEVTDGTVDNVYTQVRETTDTSVTYYTAFYACVTTDDIPSGSTFSATYLAASNRNSIQVWAIDRPCISWSTQNTGADNMPTISDNVFTKPCVSFGTVIFNESGDVLTAPAGWTDDFNSDLGGSGVEATAGYILTNAPATVTYDPTGFISDPGNLWAAILIHFQ